MIGQAEQVKEFLIKNGPSLPIEISKDLGYDSFWTKAVLVDLINQGVILQSKKPVGNSLLYYLPGQEDFLRKKLFDELSIPEKHALRRFHEEARPLSITELTPQERFMVNNLLDYLELRVFNDNKYYSLKGFNYRQSQAVAPVVAPVQIIQKIQPLPEPRDEARLFAPKPEPRVEHNVKHSGSTSFDDEVSDYLRGFGELMVTKVVRRDRETNYSLKTKEPFSQVFFVKSKNKQRINESDLSLIYTETLQEKKPGLLVTKGDLTSTAKKWMKENVGELIKLVKIK